MRRPAFARCGRPTIGQKIEQSEIIALLNAPPPLTDPPTPNPDLIRMSLDPLDRSMLVTAMAGFDESLKGGGDYHPLSSEAKRLHLSVARRAARCGGHMAEDA